MATQSRFLHVWRREIVNKKMSNLQLQRIDRARSLTLASTFYKTVMYRIIRRTREVRVLRFSDGVYCKRALASAMTKLLQRVSMRYINASNLYIYDCSVLCCLDL